MSVPLRITRSMLFVPASRPAMIEKASRSAADVVCLDLEDSVTPAEKAASRGHVVRALRDIEWGGRVRMVRINALDTPFAYRDLVDVVEAAGDHLDLVMLPKAGARRDVEFVDTLLSQIEAHGRLPAEARGSGLEPRDPAPRSAPVRGEDSAPRRIGIEAQIETAEGFLYAREIARASPRLEALIFGPGDFAASMHMPSSGIGDVDAYDDIYPGHRWHSVMQTIVAAARANGLRCMDGPYAAFKDTPGLERACRIARGLGFDGKQCIHPAQIDTANAVFTPSEEEVARAAALVQAYEAAVAAGQGAAAHEGKMIDAVNLRMARTILERRRRV